MGHQYHCLAIHFLIKAPCASLPLILERNLFNASSTCCDSCPCFSTCCLSLSCEFLNAFWKPQAHFVNMEFLQPDFSVFPFRVTICHCVFQVLDVCVLLCYFTRQGLEGLFAFRIQSCLCDFLRSFQNKRASNITFLHSSDCIVMNDS